MRKDSRPYIQLSVDFPRHPRLATLSDAQKWLIVKAWCHCGEYLTDGVVDLATWRGLGTKRNREAVLGTGIAVEFRGGEIAQIPTGFRQDSEQIRAEFQSTANTILPTDCVLFPTYLDRQSRRVDVEEMRDKRRSAGRKGGQAKARNSSKTGSTRLAGAKANGYQSSSKPVAENRKQKTEVPAYAGTPSPSPSVSTELMPVRTEERGGKNVAARLNQTARSVPAHQIAKAYSDSLPAPLEAHLLAEVGVQVDRCLSSGITPDAIGAGLQAWTASDSFAPTQIPKFVHKASAQTGQRARTKPTDRARGAMDMAEQMIQEGLTRG